MQCFKGITRPSHDHKVGSCIDNIFVKTDAIKYNAIKWISSFTDHYPLILNLIINKNESKDSKDFNFINYNKLNKLVGKVKWNELLLHDTNVTTELIIGENKNCITRSYMCFNERKNKDKNLPRKNWITKGIIISCNTKKQKFR